MSRRVNNPTNYDEWLRAADLAEREICNMSLNDIGADPKVLEALYAERKTPKQAAWAAFRIADKDFKP